MNKKLFLLLAFCLFLSAFLSACSKIGNSGIALIPTVDIEKTVHWMVDDAVMAASTQLVYEMRKEISTLIPATPSPTSTYVIPVEMTATMTSIWQGQLINPTAEVTVTPENCINRAKFVEDITIPDDTIVAAGKPFTKTWKLKNVGTCVWTDQYSFDFVDGDLMGANTHIPLPKDTIVYPNGDIQISVYMTAPEKSGRYQGNWKIKAPWGTLFGTGENGNDSVWLKIIVR
ncbi:MAG: hypothetical protein IJI41_07455 [Anaerolineaceae bacterium]|nr:hypothetical protein [Anaerolineaceae bacterium]